jgi:hypothetical protein
MARIVPALVMVGMFLGIPLASRAQEPQLVGCWSLQVGAWEPALETHDPGFPPPAWFELRGRRGGEEGPAIYGGEWAGRERHWKWSRLRRGGVAIVFSKGFPGYHLRLEAKGDRLEGTIEALSDEARGRSRAPATATRVSCRR